MNVTRIRPIARRLTSAAAAFVCLQLGVLRRDAAAAQDAATQELTLFVKEQKPFTPGYAIGNIAIGDPEVADYKVMPGRREIMLFAKGKGETRLLIWDQKNVKRHDVKITVGVKEEMQAETDLKDLLKPFPTVRCASSVNRWWSPVRCRPTPTWTRSAASPPPRARRISCGS